MGLIYAVIFSAGEWRLFRGGAQLASFPSLGEAERAGRRAAETMSGCGFATELLLQDRFGELRSEQFAGAAESCPAGPHDQTTAQGAELSVH